MKMPGIASRSAFFLIFMHSLFAFPSQEVELVETIPEPTFWLEGNSGPWGAGNPFYEVRTPLRKKLISYLNTHPSTISQLEAVFAGHIDDVKRDVASLSEAHMLRAVGTIESEAVYAPTFAILSTSDLKLLGPLMMRAAEAYAKNMNDHRRELDETLAEAGLDSTYRLPVFLGFIRDKIFYEYMEQKRLFPSKDGICPKNGMGNFYGVETHEPLSSRQTYGITHAMKGKLSFLFLYPHFRSDSLFTAWGFEHSWQAKEPFSKILRTVKRGKPTREKAILRKFRGGRTEEHAPAMLTYLVEQRALARTERGYINTSTRLKKATIEDLKELCATATMHMAEFIGGQELARLFDRSAPGRNNISVAEFREAVAWQTIWATAGFLDEEGFFPDLSESGQELFVFER